MRRWTIAATLGLIALLAAGMAALRASEGAWAESAPLAVGVLFLLLASGATCTRWRSPALAAFVVVGSIYFLMSWSKGQIPFSIPVAPKLIDRIVTEVIDTTHPQPRQPRFRVNDDRERELLERRYLDFWQRQSEEKTRQMDADFHELDVAFLERANHSRRWLDWMDLREKRLEIGHRIAHAWLSMALGGLAAFAAALIFGRRSRYDDPRGEPVSRVDRTELAP